MPYDGLSYSYLTAIRGSPGNRCLNHIPSYSRVCSQLHVSLLKLWLFLVHSSNVCFLNAVILIFGCSPIPDFWSQDYIHRHAVICDAVRVRTKCVCIYRIYIYIYMCTDIRVCILYTYIIYNVYIYIYICICIHYTYTYVITICMICMCTYTWHMPILPGYRAYLHIPAAEGTRLHHRVGFGQHGGGGRLGPLDLICWRLFVGFNGDFGNICPNMDLV